MILVVQGIVFIINLFYLTNYASVSVITQSQFDPLLNVSVSVNITKKNCIAINKDIQLAQDMIHVVMRIILPVFIMFVCSYTLIKHVLNVRRTIIRERNQKRENRFTVAVAFSNFAFLFFNLPVTVYYFILYYFTLSKITLSPLTGAQFNLFCTVANLFSCMFTLGQFWIDLAFNRLFRKEIFDFIIFVYTRRFNRVESETQNRSNN